METRTARERVDAGALVLDRVDPGWEDTIDLDTLDIRSGCRCVLAQVVADVDMPDDAIVWLNTNSEWRYAAWTSNRMFNDGRTEVPSSIRENMPIHFSDDEAVAFGFNSAQDLDDEHPEYDPWNDGEYTAWEDFDYDNLQAEWKRVILARRAAHLAETMELM